MPFPCFQHSIFSCHGQRIMLECAQNPHENPSENVEKHVGKAFAAEMERSFPQIASGRRAGRKSKALFENETILDIAAKYGKTLSQVILRWHIQRGAVPIPKSTAPGRQIENISIFDFMLSEEEVAAITALSRPDGRTFDQDPPSMKSSGRFRPHRFASRNPCASAGPSLWSVFCNQNKKSRIQNA